MIRVLQLVSSVIAVGLVFASTASAADIVEVPIPEPATITLLAGGAALYLLKRRARR